MPRRAADARDVFELQEACRFGGDIDRLRAVLNRARFERWELNQALVTLEAGRSPTVREDVTQKCRRTIERRIATLVRKESDRNRNPDDSRSAATPGDDARGST